MEDRERRIGRLEGRQEMILEWLNRLEKDLRGLKDRLAEEGVLEYTDEIDEIQQSIDRLRERLSEDPDVPDSVNEGVPDSAWGFLYSVGVDFRSVLRWTIIAVVTVFCIYFLARHKISLAEIIPFV